MNEASSVGARKSSLPVEGGDSEGDGTRSITDAIRRKSSLFPFLQKICARHHVARREEPPSIGYFALLK
jgi:hypothetical protein